MKRCPQCEFIYEDDQSLCDMDGALLVFDARALPTVNALAPVEVPMAPRAHWRHRTFPAMAALILATVFSLVYFVSTQPTASSPAPSSVQPVTAPDSNLVAPAESNPTPPPPAEESDAAAIDPEEPKPEPTKAPASSPAKKVTAKTPTTSTTQRQPAEEPKKNDSKVGSILKKTGRILKKPFKF